MSRLPVRFALLALSLLAALPLAAQTRVYTSKNTQGVTQYTDIPPAQSTSARDIYAREGTPTAPTPTRPSGNPQCEQARANLEILRGDQSVSFDNDGDGKPDSTLSAEQRAAQIELNQAAVKAACTP